MLQTNTLLPALLHGWWWTHQRGSIFRCLTTQDYFVQPVHIFLMIFSSCFMLLEVFLLDESCYPLVIMSTLAS